MDNKAGGSAGGLGGRPRIASGCGWGGVGLDSSGGRVEAEAAGWGGGVGFGGGAAGLGGCLRFISASTAALHTLLSPSITILSPSALFIICCPTLIPVPLSTAILAAACPSNTPAPYGGFARPPPLPTLGTESANLTQTMHRLPPVMRSTCGSCLSTLPNFVSSLPSRRRSSVGGNPDTRTAIGGGGGGLPTEWLSHSYETARRVGSRPRLAWGKGGRAARWRGSVGV